MAKRQSQRLPLANSEALLEIGDRVALANGMFGRVTCLASYPLIEVKPERGKKRLISRAQVSYYPTKDDIIRRAAEVRAFWDEEREQQQAGAYGRKYDNVIPIVVPGTFTPGKTPHLGG